LSKFQMQ